MPLFLYFCRCLNKRRFHNEYDFLETSGFDYEYELNYEFEFDYEYDFLETFGFEYEYEFNY